MCSSDLLEAPGRPEFVKLAPPKGAMAGAGAGGGGGYGAYFGSVPDFSETGQGVKFADVREGSPAAAAGLRRGDLLVEFDGKPVQNLYEFTYALRARKPGETVGVKLMRDGQPVEARVTLGKRQ